MKKVFLVFLLVFWGFSPSLFCQSKIDEGEKLLETGEIRKAKEVLLTVRGKERAAELLGDIASFNKDWDEAIDFYKWLVSKYPEQADYHFKLGGALGMKALESSNMQAAWLAKDIRKALVRAAELDPRHGQVRRVLVEFYMQLPGIIGGSREIAMDYAGELDQINTIDAHLARAYIFKMEKETAAMERAVKKALEQAVKDKTLISRNTLNFELGERAALLGLFREEAAGFLEEYIAQFSYKDHKSPAWAFYHLAKIRAQQEKKAEALQHINQALALKFNFPEAEREKQRILEM